MSNELKPAIDAEIAYEQRRMGPARPGYTLPVLETWMASLYERIDADAKRIAELESALHASFCTKCGYFGAPIAYPHGGVNGGAVTVAYQCGNPAGCGYGVPEPKSARIEVLIAEKAQRDSVIADLKRQCAELESRHQEMRLRLRPCVCPYCPDGCGKMSQPETDPACCADCQHGDHSMSQRRHQEMRERIANCRACSGVLAQRSAAGMDTPDLCGRHSVEVATWLVKENA